MKVKEMIELLRTIDPEKEVLINVPEYDELVPLDSLVFDNIGYIEFRVFKLEDE